MRLFNSTPFLSEPAHRHDQPAQTAILWCNLGTPDAPTAPDVRRYLREFLSDHRVVEIPRVLWWLILHGIILRTRPAKSAAKYASIWTPEGSPLKLWTRKQALLLQGWLGQRGHVLPVHFAMRYGGDNIGQRLSELKAQGVTRVLVLPAYPQYSATTTASVFDAVYAWAAQTRHVPELRFVNHYHDHPQYIEALAQSAERYWKVNGKPEVLLMSFHGVPRRTLELGDPYHCECQKTARLLATRLGLTNDQYKVSFQSRLGRAKWLEPYTAPTLKQLARSGVERVDVICPGFTSDCLETLEEINMEGRVEFLQAGGKAFHYIPCLNDDEAWITALCDIAQQHLQGWDTRARPDTATLAATKVAAMQQGAGQ